MSIWPISTNGRFLRHRPERSERCLNYEKLYQSQRPFPKSQGVPKAYRKNHVERLALPIGPIVGRSRTMGDSDYDDVLTDHAIDNAKRKPTQQKISVPCVAQRIAFRIRCNLCQRSTELGIKIVSGINAASGIPLQRFAIVNLCGGAKMTLAIKSGLSASTLTNFSPGSTGHFASIISIAASIGFVDPLGVGRNPIGRRHVVPESGDELCTFR